MDLTTLRFTLTLSPSPLAFCVSHETPVSPTLHDSSFVNIDDKPHSLSRTPTKNPGTPVKERHTHHPSHQRNRASCLCHTKQKSRHDFRGPALQFKFENSFPDEFAKNVVVTSSLSRFTHARHLFRGARVKMDYHKVIPGEPDVLRALRFYPWIFATESQTQ